MPGGAGFWAKGPPLWSIARLGARRLREAARAAGPPLLFGLQLWASVCLALYVAFWLELDNAYWAGTSAAIVCQPHLGASLRKGWFRMIGTVISAVAIVVLTACFPQDRTLFLVGLALWGAGCALVATLLRNFAAYAAALAGYTAAIIASDQLGATGGPNGQAFMLAVFRASEICIGIVCAGVVLAGTDLGGARRRVAALYAAISAEITGRFTEALGGRWTACWPPWPAGARWRLTLSGFRMTRRSKARTPFCKPSRRNCEAAKGTKPNRRGRADWCAAQRRRPSTIYRN